ncbi:MAG: hypothetical protein GXP37_10140 [Chloroflexi bacterium]|nr:hypothetical protein [Chloroflexota bacterium]
MLRLIIRFLFVVGGTLIISPVLGLLWDRIMDTAPWGFFAGVLTGIIVAVIYVVRTIQGRFLLLAPPPPEEMKEKV